MRISYWSADVCSSALSKPPRPPSHPADGRRRNVQHREVSVLASVPPSPRIARALVSVSDKSGLVAFATFLAGRGVGLLSTGGSAQVLREAGLAVVEVADPTGSPEILEIGRASCRERVCQSGLISVVAVSLTKNQNKTHVNK